MLTGLQDTYKAVCDDGNDPIREDELGELMDALERVIEYVESEL